MRGNEKLQQRKGRRRKFRQAGVALEVALRYNSSETGMKLSRSREDDANGKGEAHTGKAEKNR